MRLTKKLRVWSVLTKGISFLLLLAVALLGLRLFFYFNSKQTSGKAVVSGQVLNEPYLKKGRLNFRVDRYFVVVPYQNISFGDRVSVAGNLKNGQIEAESVEILPQKGIEGWLNEVRSRLNDQIVEKLPNPQSQLLSGVLLGIKSNLKADFKKDLVNTGTLHVVVVSGYNIALVAGLALSLSFLIGRKKASFLAAFVVLAYTLLVGFSAPTLRAAIMAVLTILATLTGRQVLAGYLLFLTAYILLIVWPQNLADISFQLTFLATLGLIVFTKPFSRYFAKLPNLIREPLSTTLAAQTLVVPVIFFYFGNVSLSAPLVNVLVLWTIPIATIVGFLYLLLLQLNLFIASLIGYLLLVPLTIFVETVEFFGRFNWLVFEANKENWVLLVGYLLIVSGLILTIWQKSYARKDI